MKKIYINDKNRKILDKYKEINYKPFLELEDTADNINELLDVLDGAMLAYHDKDWEPLKEWLEIERVRDEIYYDYFDRH